MSEKERLIRTLFESEGRRHKNIKFSRGASNNVTAEDLCREANSAIMQVETGLVDSKDSFEETFNQIDLRTKFSAA